GILAQKLDDATEKGRQEGRQEGIKIGAEKGKIEVAKNLLKAGVSVDLITESTGLPKAEIVRLKGEVTS
ncbi:MAG: transposase, partial [Wolbachia endosymbiont of Penenirmus auritus]|nr:transposase [Wolbachia endosymbiont of Penenirmus auritus]